MSQKETLARHAAEKRARVARNRRAAKLADDANVRANGSTRANATAGSKARKLIEERRADRAQAKIDKRTEKHERDQKRAADARKRQKEKDEAERDMKSMKDDQEEDDQQQEEDEAQDEKGPYVKQQPKEKGSLVGRLIGSLDPDKITTAKETYGVFDDAWLQVASLAQDIKFNAGSVDICIAKADAILAFYYDVYYPNSLDLWPETFCKPFREKLKNER